MTQDYSIIAEFPDDLMAIQKLRSENLVFNEICSDLELLGQDLALFSKEARIRNQREYHDIQESYQALLQELAEFLHRSANSAADKL